MIQSTLTEYAGTAKQFFPPFFLLLLLEEDPQSGNFRRASPVRAVLHAMARLQMKRGSGCWTQSKLNIIPIGLKGWYG